MRLRRRDNVLRGVSLAWGVLLVGAAWDPLHAEETCTPWELARPIEGPGLVSGLATGNGIVIGVGGKATFWSSTDAATWVPHETGSATSFSAAVWDGSRFLAVGSGGAVATSTDGESWFPQPRVGHESLRDVVWTGSQYVAIGGTSGPYYTTVVLRSVDGLRWSRQTLDGVYLWSLAWNGVRLVGVGETSTSGVVFTSEDGAVWTQRDSLGSQLLDVIWTGSSFVAVGTRLVVSSPDGLTWSYRASFANTFVEHVAYNGSLYVATGFYYATNSARLFVSSDLDAWTQVTPPGYYRGRSVIWALDRFIFAGPYGDVYTSEDGVAWSNVLEAPTRFGLDVVWDGSKFVTVGGRGFAATSQDGVVWVPHDIPESPFVIGIAWNGVRYLAVGTNAVLSSEDGVTWTSHPLPVATANLRTVAWNGSYFLAAGDKVLTSADGLTWTAPTTTGFQSWANGAVWQGSQWVAVGVTGQTSPDGVTWTPYQIGSGSATRGIASNGSLLIAAGVGIYTSPKGDTWTEVAWPGGYYRYDLQAVAFAGAGAFAVGGYGHILDSPDGIDWTSTPTWLGTGYSGAASSSTRRVAVGTSFAWRSCAPGADLQLSLDVDNAIARPGDLRTLTVTLKNVGPLGATSPEVGVFLPVGLEVLSDDGGGAFVPPTGAWTPGALPANESRVLHVTVAATGLGAMAPTAEVVASDQPDPDSTPGNHDPGEDDQATLSVLVGCGPVPSPGLTAPAAAASGASFVVSWTPTSLDDTYEIQEASSPTFADATTGVAVGTNQSFVHRDVFPRTYFYRVRAKFTCDGSTYLSNWSLAGQTVVSSVGPCLVGLANQTITLEQTHTSCGTLAVGPALRVESPGNLTCRAAVQLVFTNGFSVGSGATFTAGLDPSLAL